MDGNKSEEGLPFRRAEKEIFEYLSEMSKPYGTKLCQTLSNVPGKKDAHFRIFFLCRPDVTFFSFSFWYTD